MSHEPEIQTRAAQHYVAIPVSVSMNSLAAAIDESFPPLFGWLVGQGLVPGGPPFVRYLIIDMAGELRVDLGVPVAAPIAASGRVQPGTLPAGRYVVLRHTGPYDRLVASNAALQRWARERGIEFDTKETADGSVWRGRAEHYLTDPRQEPDPAKWETDVAYLIREP